MHSVGLELAPGIQVLWGFFPFFFFLLSPQNVQVPGPGIKPAPEQQRGPLQ